ncbi:MAG: imidazole glycerol phosphate synthase subunit HisH [Thaumarchaeota archaeon]|nr:imidazole glycerol phosphate synthase subunit HisH [Nitrososphaerota archaeon]
MRIGILDYGVGNLYSLSCALQKLKAETEIVTSLNKEFDGIILPGVGAFDAVTKNLGSNRHLILDVVKDGINIFGICLGMQLMFESSEEGKGDGLAIFKGSVKQLPSSVKLPHMGWNILDKKNDHAILDGLKDNSWVYFLHSYYPEPKDRKIVAATTNYGKEFTSAISYKNVFGTQFHPEKSGDVGFLILRNFLSNCKK